VRTVYGKIRQKLLPVVFVVLAFSFLAANSQAGDNTEENASQEVLARLQLSPAVKAKVDAIFAEYKGQIEARGKAMDEAYGKAMDALFAKATNKGSEDAVKAAKEKWDEETRLYSTTIQERDAKVKQALPPASAAKFARGMKLVAERNAKKQAVMKAGFARVTKDAQAAKPKSEAEIQKDIDDDEEKLNAIDTEYGKKLDAEVGKVIEQK
jgi:Skp family chaperone for outer membrane proteins